ncbi:MAG: superoxide dismutase, Fe-Mn family [Frankiaceae bacterium]|jgi:Fe-Mn family superoxide dismutase|nr:superoxide dismutase, Fe-Mn family [Frankiaceae bacterium]
MPYELPPLPYDYDALEPTIDAQTMQIHHGKHHQAYVDNLNKAVDGTEFDGRPIEQLLGALLEITPDDKQNAIRNNGGGHANHTLFWETMKPGGGGDPTGDLADAINDLWGDTDKLKAAMNDNGVKRFGSGWTWLVWDGTALALYSTPNQDSPLMQDDVPLLGIDVWEHAYYLKYQNRRPDYLGAWWEVVNWDAVGKRFDEARAG